MERRLPVVENEGYDVVLSEHIADLLGWEREDILKKIDALIREYDLDSQFDSRGNHVVSVSYTHLTLPTIRLV